MLAIRLQRTGRKGHAQYRMIVQDSHRAPSSGKVVTFLGSYNPHTKVATIDKEKAQRFLDNGAQPSDRVAGLLKKEGVTLPKWVTVSAPGKRAIRNPEKLRRNQPEASDSSAEASAKEEAQPRSDSEESTTGEPAEAKSSTDEASGAAEPKAEEPATEAEETPAETTTTEEATEAAPEPAAEPQAE